MLKPTLKKNEFLIDVNLLSSQASVGVVSINYYPITEKNLELSGQSATISVLLSVDVPEKITEQLTFIPAKKSTSFTSKDSLPLLSIKEKLLASSLGLFFRDNQNKLFALKLINIKGASSPAFKPETCLLKNTEANILLRNAEQNKSIITSKGISTEEVIRATLPMIINHHNQEIERKHAIRYPSFVLTLLRNQKLRTFKKESEEYVKHNELLAKFDASNKHSLSESERDFLQGFNQKLKEDLKEYLKESDKFDISGFDKNYSSRLFSYIDLIPDDLIVGSKNESAHFLGAIKKQYKDKGEEN
ncbi:hypothetical protein QTV49_001845 [Vibrio vulnificus]|nr:hypothetical protein [Vibrio vulnificus]